MSGSAFKFIDTIVLPRVVSDSPAYSHNGLTCATIDRPGILVLPGEPPPSATTSTSVSLSNCMVKTLYMLNFRAAPGGERIGGVPYDATLTALERTAGSRWTITASKAGSLPGMSRPWDFAARLWRQRNISSLTRQVAK